MEGTRPLLVEVQALVAPTEIVPPRRVANGVDRNRLAMILAVLARHGGPALAGADVFVNVAGGVRVDEPGADLAVALAIASAHRGEPLADADGQPLACFGEVGLTGELRPSATPIAALPRRSSSAWRPVLAPAGATSRPDSRRKRRCARRCGGAAAADAGAAPEAPSGRAERSAIHPRGSGLTKPIPTCPRGIAPIACLQGLLPS